MSTISHDYLHMVRDYELQRVLGEFPSAFGDHGVQTRVLDVGAGTGRQASALAKLGYEVVAIDLPSSDYAEARIYPVKDYDGDALPVISESIDVVFSSNVLEHVMDLDILLAETRRILAPGGIAVHVLPTSSWRWWTTFSHFGWLLKRITVKLTGGAGTAAFESSPVPGAGWRTYLGMLFPLRHGERGNTLTEPYFYSRSWWCRKFRNAGFEVLRTRSVGLFYTGSMVFAARLPLAARTALARWLGSACRIYVLCPSPTNGAKVSTRSVRAAEGNEP